MAFLPATDDNLAANDALSIRAGVSPETVRLIEATGHSYEDAARRYVDLVGLHDLGHTYTRGFGIRVPSAWAGEMLATYFAYAYLREHDPPQAEVWDGILRGYRDALRPKHTTLADIANASTLASARRTTSGIRRGFRRWCAARTRRRGSTSSEPCATRFRPATPDR